MEEYLHQEAVVQTAASIFILSIKYSKKNFINLLQSSVGQTTMVLLPKYSRILGKNNPFGSGILSLVSFWFLSF